MLEIINNEAEAAAKIIPANNWFSDNMKDEFFSKGYFARYKGTPVVVLPQSFTDETNRTKGFGIFLGTCQTSSA